MESAETFDERFFAHAQGLLDSSRLRRESCFCQHGTTSTLLHSLAVAHLAGRLALRFGRPECMDETIRAGLLHDYYLYDWHNPEEAGKGHATLHAGRALTNALVDFPDLTERERDAISCHMFPLGRPPRHRVGWFLTLADKMCASYETFMRRGRAYPRLRDKCANYLPELDLGITPKDGQGGTEAR